LFLYGTTAATAAARCGGSGGRKGVLHTSIFSSLHLGSFFGSKIGEELGVSKMKRGGGVLSELE
jgi:hypothetical protein